MRKLWLLLAALSGGCNAQPPAVVAAAAPLSAAASESGSVRMGFRLPQSAIGQQAFYEITHESGYKTHGSILPDNASHFDALIENLPAQQGYQLEVDSVLVEGCPCGASAVFNVSAHAQTTVVLKLDCPRKQRAAITKIQIHG